MNTYKDDQGNQGGILKIVANIGNLRRLGSQLPQTGSAKIDLETRWY
jgi:hypothetical protein